ncbi:Uncharacterised protein [Mycobacteroides abscessus subsp. abscessus]|nr:Uncharacterised protein [Mycobacteroides abscessus subsp. abscessus]
MPVRIWQLGCTEATGGVETYQICGPVALVEARVAPVKLASACAVRS